MWVKRKEFTLVKRKEFTLVKRLMTHLQEIEIEYEPEEPLEDNHQREIINKEKDTRNQERTVSS